MCFSTIFQFFIWDTYTTVQLDRFNNNMYNVRTNTVEWSLTSQLPLNVNKNELFLKKKFKPKLLVQNTFMIKFKWNYRWSGGSNLSLEHGHLRKFPNSYGPHILKFSHIWWNSQIWNIITDLNFKSFRCIPGLFDSDRFQVFAQLYPLRVYARK